MILVLDLSFGRKVENFLDDPNHLLKPKTESSLTNSLTHSVTRSHTQ